MAMNELLPSCPLPHRPESAGFFIRRSRPTDAGPARHCPADPPSPSVPGPELSALWGREKRGSQSPPHRKGPPQASSGPLPAGLPSHHRHCPAPGQSPRARPVLVLRTTDTERNRTRVWSHLARPLPSCATLGKMLHHSEPQFPHL